MSDGCGTWLLDHRTRATLARPDNCVLLLGSCGGFANFGDVLQLKGAIAWHRANTRLTPVLVFHASAIADEGYVARQRESYGVEAILFWSREWIDLSPMGLAPLDAAVRVPRLHVYGGGFFNRFWGRETIHQIETLIDDFGVGHYVLSGQQIDEQIAPELRAHFAAYPPILAGGRDPRSARLLQACGVDAHDSFDDAAEPIEALVAAAPPAATQSDLILHLNLSYYTGPGELDRIGEVLGRLSPAAPGGSDRRVTLLHAYNDSRVDEIVDTLGAVQRLEHRFPFRWFEVIDLSRAAVDHGAAACSPMPLPRGGIAVSCSYHVSILLSLLEIPCYLLARNPYYDQKREGLGGAEDLDAFLASPRVVDLRARFAQRSAWSQRLREAYAQEPVPREARPPRSAGDRSAAWVPKGERFEAFKRRVGELEAENRKLWQDVQWVESQRRELILALEERGRRLEEGEARERELWGDVQKLRDGFEMRGQRIAELEADCRRAWAEVQSIAKGFDERGQRVVELERELERATAECRRLWGELQQIVQGFEERGRRVRELEQQLAQPGASTTLASGK